MGSLDRKIAEHYEDEDGNFPGDLEYKPRTAWLHGLDDLSGDGHEFIDELIIERNLYKKRMIEAGKEAKDLLVQLSHQDTLLKLCQITLREIKECKSYSYSRGKMTAEDMSALADQRLKKMEGSTIE